MERVGKGPLLRGDSPGASRRGPESPLWRPLYVVVEKILGRDEPLPEDWPVYGTTGYEFLNALNGLFVDPGQRHGLHAACTSAGPALDPSFRELVYQKKFLILQVSLSSELHMLAHQLDRLSEKNRWSRDFTLNSLRHALREIIACFPVYRSYISGDGHPPARSRCTSRRRSCGPSDATRPSALASSISSATCSCFGVHAESAHRELPGPGRAAAFRRQVPAGHRAGDGQGPGGHGLLRLQPPGVAERGRRRPGTVRRAAGGSFTGSTRSGRRTAPWGLSATSTHDTKRSEDVRARLNVLSEMPAGVEEVRWRAGAG